MTAAARDERDRPHSSSCFSLPLLPLVHRHPIPVAITKSKREDCANFILLCVPFNPRYACQQACTFTIPRSPAECYVTIGRIDRDNHGPNPASGTTSASEIHREKLGAKLVYFQFTFRGWLYSQPAQHSPHWHRQSLSRRYASNPCLADRHARPGGMRRDRPREYYYSSTSGSGAHHKYVSGRREKPHCSSFLALPFLR